VEEPQPNNTNTIATVRRRDKFFIDFSTFGTDTNFWLTSEEGVHRT
jgi:hypothetical protein